jgi:regulator of PEP synthase PpsR (kinase-PPPase family)
MSPCSRKLTTLWFNTDWSSTASATPKLRRRQTILIISDTTGVTAKAAVERSLTQFNKCDDRFTVMNSSSTTLDEDDEDCELMTTKVYPFVQTPAAVARILQYWTKGQNDNLMIVFTMADPVLRAATMQLCQESGVNNVVDLLGPMFQVMGTFFQTPALGASSVQLSEWSSESVTPTPATLSPLANGRSSRNELVNGGPSLQQRRNIRRRALSESYYKNIAAVEYTLACDDGKSPHKWSDADLVIIGVSRTGKTPLSVVLSQTMALKVVNVPLVVDLPIHPNLLKLDPQRVFCLTLDVQDLLRIRQYRIQREMMTMTATTSATTSQSDWNRAVEQAAARPLAASTPAAESVAALYRRRRRTPLPIRDDDVVSSQQNRRVQRSMNQYADPAYLARDVAHANDICIRHGFTTVDVTGRAVEETASYIRSLLNQRFPDQDDADALDDHYESEF